MTLRNFAIQQGECGMAKEKLRVGYLDDDPADIEIIGRYLQAIPDWEVDLESYTEWASFLSGVAELDVDVMFLDYLLGEKTGLDVLREVRRSADTRPIIILTGQGGEQIAAELIRAGADDYLIKSELNPDMLRRSIENAVVQYQLRKEKAALQVELQHAQKLEALSTLAGGIAHDFNNMLTATIGFIDIAMMKNQDENVMAALRRANGSCEQMSRLVSQLLGFGVLDTTELEFLEIRQLVLDVVEVLRSTLPEGIQLQLELLDTSFQIYANNRMIRQILINLFSNSVDAMENGGTLTVRMRVIEVGPEAVGDLPQLGEGTYLLLEIQDTGKSIPSSIRQRIFEPFYSTKSRFTTKGIGLGLSIVWQNVKAHRGVIDIESNLDVGTTFRVYLPATSAAEGEDQPKSHPSMPDRSMGVLFVVDTDPTVLEMTRRLMGMMDYQVLIASNSLTAIRTLAEWKGKIQMVLLDETMPGVEGNDCLEQFLAIDSAARVLITSSKESHEKEAEVRKRGAMGIIRKPFRLAELTARISQAVTAL